MNQDTAIFEQPLGDKRDGVVADADKQWQSNAKCALEKTGVGLQRRAYFLERCSYQNPTGLTVCGLVPESVEYAFLESALLQIKYTFKESDRASYAACLQEQAKAKGFAISEQEMPNRQARDRVRLITQDAQTGVTIGGNREVRVYNAELTPQVHMLRDDI